MKKYVLLLLCTSLPILFNAQIEGCDGSRYQDDIFEDIKVTTGIKYGEGETFSGIFQELFLDVYEPANDELERRPVIVLAFGGSYIGGNREDLEFLCEAYARKGYVAVTIDYRLYDGPLLPPPGGDQMKVVVVKSVSDMRAAIRHMRQDADMENLFKIDPDQVFVGGVSAGSITAFHTAVLDETDDLPEDIMAILADNGGIEGNSSMNYEYSSEVQGLVNFSGGLNNAIWIDENDPPFVSIHDDMDPIVPYDQGFASIFNIPIIYMEGSKRCQEVADSVGVVNQLKIIEESNGHVSYFSNLTDIALNINYTADFLAELVCGDITSDTEDIADRFESVQFYPNPSPGQMTISNPTDIELKVQVLDMYGRNLINTTQNSTLDLSAYPNGIYFAKMTDQNSNSTKTIKLILEK